LSERTLTWPPASRWVRWGLVIAVAVVAVGIGVHVALRGGSWNGVEERRAAAALLALELPDENGTVLRMEQWRGRVLVVNFWATWCVPCREEMPQFMKAQEAQGSRGLQFVGIAVDQPDKVVQFVKELRLNYPTMVGGMGAIELSRDLGNRLMALPFTIVLDRAGRVAHTQLGPLSPDKLRGIVDPLLAEKG
jgi:thiol-disulfide isomerase/thioredoxin